MTSADGRSAQHPVDERRPAPAGAQAVDEERHGRRVRSARPTRARMVSALRGAARRVVADRDETPIVAARTPGARHGRAWGRPDTLAAGTIALAPAVTAVLGGVGAPLWAIGLLSSALVLALGVMLLRALTRDRQGAGMSVPAAAGQRE